MTTPSGGGSSTAGFRRDPELFAWKVAKDTLSAELLFPADGQWFNGHFPGFPVLPGVAQLFFFRRFARKAFREFPDAGAYRRIKFRRLVRPGERVLLEVERQSSRAMSFKMSVGGEIASCGSVEAAEIGESPQQMAPLPQSDRSGLPQSVLFDLLPHKPPMTMLSDVIAVDEPGAAVAVVDSSACSLFYDEEIGGVPACAALEYMAQTMALAVGAERYRRGEVPKIGFVLGTRRLDVGIPVFESSQRYAATARCAYFDDEFASFDCAIFGPGGEAVAKASLTAYQPPESMLAEGDVVLKGGRQ